MPMPGTGRVREARIQAADGRQKVLVDVGVCRRMQPEELPGLVGMYMRTLDTFTALVQAGAAWRALRIRRRLAARGRGRGAWLGGIFGLGPASTPSRAGRLGRTASRCCGSAARFGATTQGGATVRSVAAGCHLGDRGRLAGTPGISCAAGVTASAGLPLPTRGSKADAAGRRGAARRQGGGGLVRVPPRRWPAQAHYRHHGQPSAARRRPGGVLESAESCAPSRVACWRPAPTRSSPAAQAARRASGSSSARPRAGPRASGKWWTSSRATPRCGQGDRAGDRDRCRVPAVRGAVDEAHRCVSRSVVGGLGPLAGGLH